MLTNKWYRRQVKNWWCVLLGCLPLIAGLGQETSEPAASVHLRLDPMTTYQTIDNFGASDAWACQYVGLWDDSVKERMADLLFSQELRSDGSPKGIGLSAWRFNIGAGSAQQGDRSGIRDPWRRAESFLLSDGRYDFSKAAGQRWFLKAAAKRKVQDFIAFSNSAPCQLTRNGFSYASGGKSNLAPEHYGAFADYLVEVIKGVAAESGVQFNYVSPVNEPQWDWSDAGQEGSPYLNSEIAALTRVLDQKLTEADLNTKISVAEAGQIDYLYKKSNKPKRGEQLRAFFDPGSSVSLLDLEHLSYKITAHSYFTSSPYKRAGAARQALWDSITSMSERAGIKDLGYWMSEYCILGDNAGEINGNGRDLGMAAALYLASVIHMDLCFANASAWQWWLAISPYDYKDGLIYVDKSVTTGKYYESKMLWVLGNYSRFIRPGYVRIKNSLTGGESTEKDLLVSSFKDPASDKVVIVVANPKSEDQQLTMDNLQVLDQYITSDKYNMKHFKRTGVSGMTIPGASVVTITAQLR